MAKTDRCVVRNEAYKKSEFSLRERHNERLNETYYNSDIQADRQHLNVNFKRCKGGYTETYDKMLADGVIKEKGLRKDGSSKVLDEFVFDVNTEYFDRNGGYEYAKSFFEEAYRCAVKEAGGEQYVLSAVMHADERNVALSEKLGRDVYHYHLHVLYVPVVRKECYFSKDNKNPDLAGKLKEVITQVSHTKKWPRFKTEKGWVNSYSLLQDRYHEHMKNTGFIGFERGERGSTAEHLSVLEYKTQKEMERAAAITAVVEQKQEAAAALDLAIGNKEQIAAELDKKTEKKQKQLDGLEKKTSVLKEQAAEFADIDGMVKPTLIGGNLQISSADWKTVSGLAKEGVKSRGIIAGLQKKITDFVKKVTGLETELNQYKGGISDNMRYFQALQRAPRHLREMIDDILRKPPEQQQQRQDHSVTKKKDLSR